MKATFIFTLLLFALSGLHAQNQSLDVLGNAGGHGAQADAQLSWTLGELSIATLNDPQASLTQGFHQTSMLVTALDNAFPTEWEVTAYPNPVSDVLHVRWNETQQPVNLRLTNLSGQLLYQNTVEGDPETKFQVNHYPQGIYFLEVVDEHGDRGKTFKVEIIRQ
ncbi:MAG: T9SS type A sorting domain-containing protein [Bacteroidota bacterium]